ncbi:MAG: 1-acyl-sn-glycerol-3-phosphate acyltransferase [Roseburia sp.]|uniref:lysophospholipid acyltransferase family protein n=1 Tax=Roseburia sp. 831b TaxID=1261635 RepID=UPI00095170B7|nr:lysophospholipid acyltransferase family protein [Roseburia sp. 831b]MCI5918305.1 1-acyl-sn-glycerol-3-phosphate acyltransferase [Roseburia sp.]MDY5883792.1 lysophospholipid acyltransferase family protein [Roseburia sp.]WVK73964.1 lysophospholipid acyltransferase family protein [Roseburia sp. 831b]
MIKFIYVILMNLFRAPYMIPKMRKEADHPERYTIEERYQLAKHCVRLMKMTGAIKTKAYGIENLPKEGGYMMYPNHQGKYDALGIIYTHKKPCSLVMDKAKSNTILVREFVDLLEGKRLDKKDVRQALTVINEVSEEVKNGKIYILFPEGGYEFNNRNKVYDFKAGSFKIALKTKAPIVPVALIDSYRVFNSAWLGPVTTQVHYLKPITYEEYKGMKTQEIAAMVKDRISEKISSVLESQKQG